MGEERAAGDVLVVVTTESDAAARVAQNAADNQHLQRLHQRQLEPEQPVAITVDSKVSEPLSLTECARSVVSYASSSIRRSTISYQQRQARAQWKGLGSRCMWEACRATFLGLFLLISGSIIVLVGFHSELPSMETTAVNRTSYMIDPKSQKRHKLTYSYVGPVFIGTGVFILIGVGVATMEMRDMTAKVFPLTKRITPHRKAASRSNQSTTGHTSQVCKLTVEVLSDMFQTPTQRAMKEINESRLERSRTVCTQTAHSPRTRRSASSSKKLRLYRRCMARIMSADDSLSAHPSQQLYRQRHKTILSLGSFVSRHRQIDRSPRRLFIHTPLRQSSAFSCPHLSTIS